MYERSRWTLTLVCVAIFMLVLDTTIVAVALSDIQHDLDASLASLQWVVDAYTLPLAAFLLPAASLGDRVGRAPLFVVGITVFTVSSAACALAPGAVTLDVFRAVQGLGGAVLYGVGIPLIADAYPAGRGRDLAIGMFGAVSGSAVAVGPLAGGVLTELFGWRAIFWVNVPIGAAVLVVSRFALIRTEGRVVGRIDWAGAATSSVGLFLLVFGCTEGPHLGWAHPRIAAIFAGAALAFALFVLVELRAAAPMVDLGLFLVRSYTVSAAVGFVLQATLVASTTYLSLYVQNVLGFSPLGTGLRFLPFSLAAFAAAALVAPLLHRVGGASLVAGTALSAAAGLELIALGRAGSFLDLLPGFVVCGAALGMGTTVLNRVSVTGISAERLGAASGTANALRQSGVAIGVATLGVIYHDVIRDRALSGLSATPGVDAATARRVADAAASGAGTDAAASVAGPLRVPVARVAAEATVDGLDRILHTGAAAAVLVAVVAAVVLRPRRSS